MDNKKPVQEQDTKYVFIEDHVSKNINSRDMNKLRRLKDKNVKFITRILKYIDIMDDTIYLIKKEKLIVKKHNWIDKIDVNKISIMFEKENFDLSKLSEQTLYKFKNHTFLENKFLSIICEEESYLFPYEDRIVLTLTGGGKFINSCGNNTKNVYLLYKENTKNFIKQFNHKPITNEQRDYDLRYGIIKEKINTLDNIYYSLFGNKDSYERIIFAFPSMAKYPKNYVFFPFDFNSDGKDLIIAFSDRYLTNGSYMRVDNFYNDITNEIVSSIQEKIARYKKDNTEIIFSGSSKGGTIAAYYAQHFINENIKLNITCPQIDLEVFLKETVKENAIHRLNYVSALLPFCQNGEYKMLNYKKTPDKYIFSSKDIYSDDGYYLTQKYNIAVESSRKHILIFSDSGIDMYPNKDVEEINNKYIKYFFNNDKLQIEIDVEKFDKSIFSKYDQLFLVCKTDKDVEYKSSMHLWIDNSKNKLILNNKHDILLPNFIKKIEFLELVTNGRNYKLKIPSKIKNYLLKKENKTKLLDVKSSASVDKESTYETADGLLLGISVESALKIDHANTKIICQGIYENKLIVNNQSKLQIHFKKDVIQKLKKVTCELKLVFETGEILLIPIELKDKIELKNYTIGIQEGTIILSCS